MGTLACLPQPGLRLAAEAQALAVIRPSGGEAERGGGAASSGGAALAQQAQAGKLRPFVELARQYCR